jgi:hypothetical protein
MRIDGQSWAQIAEKKGLGSPGSARKLFTKETGITDYKIKKEALKVMLENGYDVGATAEKMKNIIKEAEHQADTTPTFTFTKHEALNTKHASLMNPGESIEMDGKKWTVVKKDKDANLVIVNEDGLKKKVAWDKDVTVWKKPTEDLPQDFFTKTAKKEATPTLQVQQSSAEKAITMYKKGSTYTQIVNSTGLDFAQVDQIVWADIKANISYTPQAFLVKPTSQSAINEMKQWIATNRAQGYTWEEIVNNLDAVVPGKFNLNQVKAIATKDVQSLAVPGALANLGAPSYVAPSTFEKLPKIVGSGDYPLFGEQGALDWHSALGNDLTAAQLRALKTYTGSSYSQINSTLRNGISGTHWEEVFRDMDAGMRPIPSDVTLIRRTGYDAFGGIKDFTGMEGQSFADPGYLSTAVREGVWHGSIEMEIHAPAGTMGRYVNPFSSHKGEMEVILGRDTEFLIEKVERTSGGSSWRLTVSIIGQGGA